MRIWTTPGTSRGSSAIGFAGNVHCSEATRDLCEVLLLDSAHLQEQDAEYANRRGFSKHKPALPLYTVHDAERALAASRRCGSTRSGRSGGRGFRVPDAPRPERDAGGGLFRC